MIKTFFSNLLFLIKFYSYLKALNVLIFDIFIAGKYDAIAEIIKEIKIIINRDLNLFHLVIYLKNIYQMEKFLN